MKNILGAETDSGWSILTLIKFLVIFLLGISAGIPLAVVLSTIKAFLYEKGASLELIGFLGLISIAYSVKVFFAPALDSIKIFFISDKIGFRKSWIFILQILIACAMLLLAIVGTSDNMMMILFLASFIAMVSACQDVVIDGYRIELFDKRDQGLASSFYIFGYRFGLLISGGLALFIADIFDWRTSFTMISCVMFVIAIITLFIFETKKGNVKRLTSFSVWFRGFVVSPLSDFIKRNNFIVIAVLILSFKLADSFAGSLSIPFLLDVGFNKTQIAAIVKTFGIFATLFGVFFGGLLIKQLGIYKCLVIATFLQSLSNLSFAYLANVGNDESALYLVIFAENFSGGIGDAVFVAYLSSLCNIRFSATQYAILTSIASLSRAFLASSSGVIVASIGWYQFFIFSTFLALPTLICLFLIYRTRVRT